MRVKGLKLKFKKYWELIITFWEIEEEKLVGGWEEGALFLQLILNKGKESVNYMRWSFFLENVSLANLIRLITSLIRWLFLLESSTIDVRQGPKLCLSIFLSTFQKAIF